MSSSSSSLMMDLQVQWAHYVSRARVLAADVPQYVSRVQRLVSEVSAMPIEEQLILFTYTITCAVLLSWALRVVRAVLAAVLPGSSRLDNVTLPPESLPEYELSGKEIDVLADAIEGDSHEFRRRMRTHCAGIQDVLVRGPDEDDMDMMSQRKLALTRMRTVLKAGEVSVHDIINDPLKFIASHDILGSECDPSSVYLYSVHMNLFGGSVLKLGTDTHHTKYIKAIDRMEYIGCFALTEAVHGVNSGFNMDTFAVYDSHSQEFIIHTPTLEAQKTWISLAANNARYAVVFAKLMIDDVDEGVHAFFVRVRDDAGNVVKGVQIADQGHKPAINGNDNGRLMFSHMRVPREALLDRYAQVSAAGVYTSSIKKKRDRFLKVADQLISGRICIASVSSVLASRSLADAITYSIVRKAHRWNGTQISIYDNMSHRRQLTTLMARLFALKFGTNYAKKRYAKQTAHDREEVVDLVCGMKSHATQESVHMSGIARDKCGGVALVSASRLCELNVVAASLAVVEGDAAILAQKCAKTVLASYSGGGGMLGLIKTMVLGKARSQLYRAQIWAADQVPGAASRLGFYSLLFAAREQLVVMELASKLYTSVSSHRIHMLDAWAKCHLELVMQVHRAHIVRVCFRKFVDVVEQCKDARVRRVLHTMCMLYATQEVERDFGWFVRHTPINRDTGTAISDRVTYLCTRITKGTMTSIIAALRLPQNTMLSNAATFQESLRF